MMESSINRIWLTIGVLVASGAFGDVLLAAGGVDIEYRGGAIFFAIGCAVASWFLPEVICEMKQASRKNSKDPD